jgi:putative transposase
LGRYVTRSRDKQAALRFIKKKSLQKCAAVHASLHNHFKLERHLADSQTYKLRCSAAWTE